MKSEGVKDIVDWMENKIKEKKKSINHFSSYSDLLSIQEAELLQMVKWKISTEKYMKKLKHQGE